MKLSHIVTVSALIAVASARGIRGASERAFYFSTYVSEEIFTDASKRTVATGCVGTRKGLRDQPNRCTFLQFCDHLWHETAISETEMDKRPEMEKVIMGTIIRKNKDSLQNYSPEAMREAIMSMRVDIGNGKSDNAPKWGYSGDLHVANLVEGGTADNYFDKVGEEFGQRFWKAKQEFLKVKAEAGDTLGDDLTQLFQTWNDHAVKSSKMSYAYREKELRMREAGAIRTALKEKYPDEPEIQKLIKTETKLFQNTAYPGIKAYKVYDKDATATTLASIPELGLTKDQALTLLTDVHNELQTTPTVYEHQRALAGARKAMNVAEGGCI